MHLLLTYYPYFYLKFQTTNPKFGQFFGKFTSQCTIQQDSNISKSWPLPLNGLSNFNTLTPHISNNTIDPTVHSPLHLSLSLSLSLCFFSVSPILRQLFLPAISSSENKKTHLFPNPNLSTLLLFLPLSIDLFPLPALLIIVVLFLWQWAERKKLTRITAISLFGSSSSWLSS